MKPSHLLPGLCALLPIALSAGSYAPAAGKAGSTAVYKTDAVFLGWASSVVSYHVGTDVEAGWMDTNKCLGAPGNDVYDITCLGNGGDITLSFEHPIADGPGWDFAVFENAFAAGFLELAYVEVSSDGVNFVRFPCHSETPSRVGAFANTMDATNLDGLASKYMLGYGTPFDLADLSGLADAQKLDLDAVIRVRLVDIVGDGSCKDSDGRPIYDPTPTVGSGGFDLDAVGVAHFQMGEALWESFRKWQNTWYGRVYPESRYGGWVYSADNGSWQYALAATNGMWVYDFELGWLYASRTAPGYLYLFPPGAWAFSCGADGEGTRWYYLWDDAHAADFPLYPYVRAEEIAALVR